MKRLIVLAVLLLNGCAVYDAYFMTGYDSNEYRIITEIRVDASIYKTACDNKPMSEVNATQLAYKTELFEKYSEQIPNNNNGYSASKSLNEIAQGLVARYRSDPNVPALFCRLKFANVEHSAEVIQHVIARRPR
jgi:hypothetical protein